LLFFHYFPIRFLLKHFLFRFSLSFSFFSPFYFCFLEGIYKEFFCTCRCRSVHLHAGIGVVNTFSGFCSKPSNQMWKSRQRERKRKWNKHTRAEIKTDIEWLSGWELRWGEENKHCTCKSRKNRRKKRIERRDSKAEW
jgi:hypothetical protein